MAASRPCRHRLRPRRPHRRRRRRCSEPRFFVGWLLWSGGHPRPPRPPPPLSPPRPRGPKRSRRPRRRRACSHNTRWCSPHLAGRAASCPAPTASFAAARCASATPPPRRHRASSSTISTRAASRSCSRRVSARYISPISSISPLQLPCISPISRLQQESFSPLHLPYIYPVSPLYLPISGELRPGRRVRPQGCIVGRAPHGGGGRGEGGRGGGGRGRGGCEGRRRERGVGRSTECGGAAVAALRAASRDGQRRHARPRDTSAPPSPHPRPHPHPTRHARPRDTALPTGSPRLGGGGSTPHSADRVRGLCVSANRAQPPPTCRLLG